MEGAAMPKYLVEASYSPEGLRGVRSKGGTARRDAVTEAVKSFGGSLESFYFAFGGTDVFAIADLPDNTAAAAMGLAVGASGGGRVKTVVLMTPEEIDTAVSRQGTYRPPGG
jgi:uncharacterized protein with GYD domain